MSLKMSQNSQKNTCNKVNKPPACNFITKETLTQVISCEFCEIFQKNFFIKNTSDGYFKARLINGCLFGKSVKGLREVMVEQTLSIKL